MSTNANAWGKNGHRIIGKITEWHLTPTTLMAIEPLLAGDKLSEVTTWADEMRSNPDEFWRKQSGKWHYISIPSLKEFNPNAFNGKVTNIHTAILKSINVLKDSTSSLEDKQFYFKFLTHLVGDLHQPLHVGRSEDRGGNTIKVKFFNDDVNLHTVWDTKLIESENLSYNEFAEYIDTSDVKTISTYLNSRPADWLKESFKLRSAAYDIGDGNFRYNYLYKHMPTVKERLLQGGIRLAGLLNEIYDPKAEVLKHALAPKK